MRTTLTDLPAFLEGIAIVHGAMRRDVDRLVPAIERVATTDQARALQRWFAKLEREIEHHHLREDDVVWPMLLERAPDFAEPLVGLEADHHALDAAMADTRAAVAALAARPDYATCVEAAASATALRDLLHGHLDREEAAALPLLARTFTSDTFAELERQLFKATPKRLIAFELPFACDGLAADVASRKLAELPLVIRVLHRLVWQPAYDRLVTPLV